MSHPSRNFQMNSKYMTFLIIAAFNGAAFCDSIDPPSLRLPPRQADAVTGSQFAKQIESFTSDEREAAILQQILQGNIPDFVRHLTIIRVNAADANGQEHRAMY